MSISQLIREITVLFRRWFHKRNIIIISDKQVKHVPVSGALQFSALMVAAGFVFWASYSTGSFVAARNALKEQGQALRSVASAHVATSLNPLYKTAAAASSTALTAPTEPKFTLTALENDKMASRVAYLESKIDELQTANAEIIQRVQEKTAGKIDDLKNIIKRTGLNSERVRKSSKPKNEKSQGGPYIPADMTELKKSADALFSDLDELSELRRIVSALPLGNPIRGAQQQSPFGHRYDPFTNRLAFHSGLDLSGPYGANVTSTADGVVAAAGRNGAYGNMVDINHGNGVTTRYAHMREVRVKPGQTVRKGQVIGIQGSTGRSTGSHLHYEVRYHDKPMDPKKFLQAGHYVSKE